jgi:hypothetical protein
MRAALRLRSWLNPIAALFPVLLASPVVGQHPFATGAEFDSRVPTPRSVLGYEPGERFTPHHMLTRYFERVAVASPRVTLDTVAHTFEGREVLMAVITSEANQQRIASILAAARRLSDPRGASPADLEQAMSTLPAIVWLGYTVHGNEASGVEAAIAFLYQLAAGQDEQTRMILDSAVVLIDPVQNPDGHERHVQYNQRMRGALGVPTLPAAYIHGGDWPGARTSHYYFDLNRDWFVRSHPETRGRAETMLRWWPHVVVDLHEMGSSSTYYFAPPMEPVNTNIDATVRKWWDIFGEANASAFDRHGWSFFRREGYDGFYPGYGDAWPTFLGAVGMTYEQASSSGGAIRRSDGTVMTLSEAAHHHYTTSWATTFTTASRRTERLRDYLEFRRTAISEAMRSPLRQVIIERDTQGRADSLVARLIADSIEVFRFSAPVEARTATQFGGDRAAPARFATGDYVIDLAQPQGRLARTLLEPDAHLDSAFIAQELENRRNAQGDRFYDITAWSLPYVFRVRAWSVTTPLGSLERVTRVSPPPPPMPGDPAYGYAFEAGTETSIRLLGRLLADSIRVWYAPRAFRTQTANFPEGAFVVRVAANGPDLRARMQEHITASGATVVGLATALAEEGTDLGSNSVFYVRPPRIAIATGAPIQGGSFGTTWYAFDQRLRYPATPVPLTSLAGALREFDVLVMPSATSAAIDGALGDGGRNQLTAWVRAGGVLVTMDGSTTWLATERLGLSRFRLRRDSTRADSAGGAPLPTSVPGAIVRARGDTLSWLLAGVTSRDIPVLVNSDRVYQAPKDLRAGEVVLRLAPLAELRLAGYMWPEMPERLAESPFVWTESVGQGRVIGFSGDPLFRDMWRGLLPIFANAVFLGASQ